MNNHLLRNAVPMTSSPQLSYHISVRFQRISTCCSVTSYYHCPFFTISCHAYIPARVLSDNFRMSQIQPEFDSHGGSEKFALYQLSDSLRIFGHCCQIVFPCLRPVHRETPFVEDVSALENLLFVPSLLIFVGTLRDFRFRSDTAADILVVR